jgi:aryl-alcohol dehydrogenase-like predicted oxidoreductase
MQRKMSESPTLSFGARGVDQSMPRLPTATPIMPAPKATRTLGPHRVGAIGLGCMSLSHAYGTPPPDAEAERLLLTALDAGVTLFDTAALYGFGANETLVGRVLKAHRGRIVLCSKGGLAGETFADGVKRVIDGRPATLRRHCETSLGRLQTDHIDLYYLHRWDKTVPVEDSVGELARLAAEGKIGSIGLSEVSAATLMKAHAVHPIAAVQTEYSLWTRNPEIAVLQACHTIGATFVAFSPLARGFLAHTPLEPDRLDAKDFRRNMPRFQPPHWAHNRAVHARAQALAQEAGCTLPQLALAWVLSRGDHVLPIPGTTRVDHLRENLAAAELSVAGDVLQRLQALFDPAQVSGGRYSAASEAEVDTETFATR